MLGPWNTKYFNINEYYNRLQSIQFCMLLLENNYEIGVYVKRIIQFLRSYMYTFSTVLKTFLFNILHFFNINNGHKHLTINNDFEQYV